MLDPKNIKYDSEKTRTRKKEMKKKDKIYFFERAGL
jgi:hypothetical protein